MKKVLILTISALMLLAGMAVAQPGGKARGGCDGNGPHGMRECRFDGPGRGGPGGPMGLLGMADDLGLSDAQIDAMETMAEQFRMQMIDHRAAVEKAELKLRSLERDNASESTVGTAIDDLSRLRAEGQKMRYAHRQKMRAQLSAEQQKKLDELRRERPGRGRGQGNSPGLRDGGARGPGGGMGCIYKSSDLNNNG